MKKIFTLMCGILFASFAHADLSKGSSQMNSLSSAWKNHSIQRGQSKNDMAMVYAGDDVASRTIAVEPTAA